RGGSITAVDGDVVLGAETVTLGTGSDVSAPGGAVRIVSASQFALNRNGVERISEGGAPGAGVVLNTGQIEGQTVEVKSTGDINNAGRIAAGGGAGNIFLRVGPNGTVFNEGTGTLLGMLQVTGNFDDVGISLGPDDLDAAVATSDSTINLPDLQDPRGRKTKGRVISRVGGAAGSAAVAREKRTQRAAGTSASRRKMLNRKSSFFGLVGRGQAKP
ncbi:MAG: hypothetical protein HKO57_01930, partial [Akkermansiaceae bacterium]|nr:hypothetical protein [Akkermansiaceae bacterium]